MKKQLISVLLTFALLLQMFAMPAFAAENSTPDGGYIPVESITMDNAKKLVWVTTDEDANETFSTLVLTPANADCADGKGIVWTSNNPGVAEVIDGELIIYSLGVAKLTATFTGYADAAGTEIKVVSTFITYAVGA